MRFEACIKSIIAGGSLVAALLLAGCGTTAPASASGDSGTLAGTWRIVSFEREYQNTSEREFPMGRNPVGFTHFLPGARLAVVITAEGRTTPATDQDRAGLYNSLVAYAGRYRVEGDKWITTVEASANPAWVGTDQPRTFRLAGDRL